MVGSVDESEVYGPGRKDPADDKFEEDRSGVVDPESVGPDDVSEADGPVKDTTAEVGSGVVDPADVSEADDPTEVEVSSREVDSSIFGTGVEVVVGMKNRVEVVASVAAGVVNGARVVTLLFPRVFSFITA